jgi:hypothetical protein
MIASGMLSSFLPARAARWRVRGWSHRTTPVGLVPASVSGTATPAVRAKLPPLVFKGEDFKKTDIVTAV